MAKLWLAYIVFFVILVMAVLLLPAFYLSGATAALLATLCVIRWSGKLSLLVLSLIVITVTIGWPVWTLFAITQNSGVSPIRYLAPTSLANIINIIGLCLPTLAMIALVLLGWVAAGGGRDFMGMWGTTRYRSPMGMGSLLATSRRRLPDGILPGRLDSGPTGGGGSVIQVGIPGPCILRIQAIGATGTHKIRMAKSPSGHRTRESFGLARRNPNRASVPRTQVVTPKHGRRPLRKTFRCPRIPCHLCR